MKFPFKNKTLKENNSEQDILKDCNVTEIPFLPHPGAFSCVRKNHIHEGIDLYCCENEEVVAMEPGKIVSISIFTGAEVNSPWWNTTWSVMIESFSGVINYGEIKPLENLAVGQEVKEGQLIGNVIPVLKKDKGRPMNMLHLELYTHGTTKYLQSWELNFPQPENLLNPNILLQSILNQKKSVKIKVQ